MPVSEVVAEHYAKRQSVVDDVASEGLRLWREVDTADIAGSWQESVSRLTVALAAAQRLTAADAENYASAVLRALNVDTSPEGLVNAAALSGRASDGRSLITLLQRPVITAKVGLASGTTLNRAMASGQANLEMILRTQVADAGRVADGVAVAARPTVGYVRHVTPPSCPRCAILAGKFYRYNRGFLRHPRCDCRHIPAPESVAGDLTTDPKRLFDEGQIRGLSKADAQAIRDGADISQVVNAHRGMYTAGGRKFTTEGTTRRGIASQSRRLFGQNAPLETTSRSGRRTVRRVMRPRPEQIYRDATSRQNAIRLLKLYGYLG